MKSIRYACLISLICIPSALRANVPVVDFGDDYTWYGGLPLYRGEAPVHLYAGGPRGDNTIDVSGEGTPHKDSVVYYPFDLETPLNPVGGVYRDRGNNARFYGGLVSYFANRMPRWSEGGINIDHEGRDDFNLHSYATEGGDVALRTYGLWLWQKKDFLNGGDQFPVRFDADSQLAVYISRYYRDYEESRFVVRDGDTFFISEHTFGGTHTLHQLRPLESRWAIYTPTAPHTIEFDAATAAFEERVFTNITAAGWYVAKPTLGPAALWLKWYAFGMDAVVDAPERLSAMQPSTEQPVSYAEWRRVFDWSARNQYALHPGYAYANDGVPQAVDDQYDPALPVTGITMADAAVWCNALSEYEGRTPVFYEDAEHTMVWRRSIQRYAHEPPLPEMPHTKPDADGYLPVLVDDGATGFLPIVGSENAVVFQSLEKIRSNFPIVGKKTEPVLQSLEDTELPPMVSVPAGRFIRSDEAEVDLSPFEMSATEITYAQWIAVKDWAATHGYRFDYPGAPGSMDWGQGVHAGDEPVTRIGQRDAMAWCNALSEFTGRTPVYYVDAEKSEVLREVDTARFSQLLRPHHAPYARPVYKKWEADGFRLPTMEEWEYAARAGSSARFPWGEEWTDDFAWTAHNSGDRTQPVARLQPNAFGLYDLIGNVFEWVWGGVYDYYSPEDPRGDGRALARGGSFRGGQTYHDTRVLEPANWPNHPLGQLPVGAAYPEIGFRIVRCEAGTHPAEPPPYVPRVVLEVQPEDIDPLQGRVWRGNIGRTGEYEGAPPMDEPEVRWTFQTGGPVKSSPVFVDGRLFVGSDDGRFYALDAASGGLLWSFDSGAPVRSSALVVKDTVFVSARNGLHALVVQTGEVRWHLPVDGGWDMSPLAAGGLVFWQRPWQKLTGWDMRTGEERWRHRDWNGIGRGTSSAAIDGVTIAWANGSPGCSVADLRTERLRFRYDGAADTLVYTPALRDGGMVVVGNHGVSEVDLASGEFRWSFWQPHWDTRHPRFSPPAMDGEHVFIGNRDFTLYALSREDGQEVWRYKAGGEIYSAPALSGGLVVFGSRDGHLYALDRDTGELRWSVKTGGPIESSPAVAGPVVYIGSDDGRVYALFRDVAVPP